MARTFLRFQYKRRAPVCQEILGDTRCYNYTIYICIDVIISQFSKAVRFDRLVKVIKVSICGRPRKKTAGKARES
jgi:hypothetical protein